MAANTTPSFNTLVYIPTGITTLDASGLKTQDQVTGLAIQADGRLLMGGYTVTGDENGTTDFSLVRLNTDGTLDTSFNSDGKFTLDVGSIGKSDRANSLLLQSNGKVVLAGTSRNNSTNDFSLIRLNTDGTLDTSFSGDGKLTIDAGSINNEDEAHSVTQQSDGKLVVAGFSASGTGSGTGTGEDFCLIRLNIDGTLDTSFSDDGKVTIDAGSSSGFDHATSVTVQSDGKLVVAGYSGNSTNNKDFSLVRLNTDGTPDNSFSGDGKVTLDVGGIKDNDQAHSVTTQSDGKLVVAGYSVTSSGDADFSLLRLNTDGTLDTGFGTGGKLILDTGGFHGTDIAYSVSIQSNGKLVVAGSSSGYFSLVRLNADGSLDTSFSADGKLLQAVSTGDDEASSVAIQSDGKLIVAGSGGGNGNADFSLIRLNTDGTLDTSFGDPVGFSVSSLGSITAYNENSAAVVIDASVVLTDADLAALNSGAGNYAGTSVILSRTGGANAQDVFSGSGNLSFSGSNVLLSGVLIGTLTHTGGVLSIIFNANTTQARLNEALSSIAYANTSDAPPASVQITWTFNDGNIGAQGTGGTATVTGNSTVNISAVNDAPVITGLPVGTQSIKVGRTVALADFTVADADGANANLTVTLTPVNGTLGNVTDADLSLPGIQLTGTATQINAAIAAATFTATAGGSNDIAINVTDGVANANAVYSFISSGANTAPTFDITTRTGITTVDAGGTNGDDRAASLAIQSSDGMYVVAGTSLSSNGNEDFGLIRLTTDGTPDIGFSNDGKLTLDAAGFNNFDEAAGVVVQSDGKLVVAGTSTISNNDTDFSLARFNPDGTLDTSFSGDGTLTFDLGGIHNTDQAIGLVLQSSGKLVVAGSSWSQQRSYDISLTRFNADGTLDTSFSGDGTFILDAGRIKNIDHATSVIQQSDGMLVVAGYSVNSNGNKDFCLTRLSADGMLDIPLASGGGFSTDGIFKLDVNGLNTDDEALSVIQQLDGKLVVAGYSVNSNGNKDFCLIRLNTDGTLDTSFGTGGKFTLDVGGLNTDDQAFSVFQEIYDNLASDQKKLTVAGYSINSNGNKDFSLIRLNANGTLDTSFSEDGKLTLDVGGINADDQAFSVVQEIDTTIQPYERRLLVAGYSVNGNGNKDFSLIRLNNNGTLNERFGTSVVISSVGDRQVTYIENGDPVALDTYVVVSDDDLDALGNGIGNFGGASVTLARTGGANAQDVFSARGRLDFSGNQAILAGTTVGTVTNSGGTLVITFNTNATKALVSETLSDIAYANTSDAPPSRVQLAWTFSDGNTGAQGTGGALTTTGTTTVNITAIGNPIVGTNAANNLVGTDIADTINGLDGNDTLRGGMGNDSLDGGAGIDTATYVDASSSVSVILYGNQAFGLSSGNDTLVGIENIIGTAYADLIFGDAAGNHFIGGAGNDSLEGADGNDSLDGGDGGDILYGWNDNDTLVGGVGADRLFGGAGIDRLDGGADADQLEGDDGNDTIAGSTGNDTLRGWNDDDSLDGGEHDDVLFGGAGADSMSGGSGDDQLEGDDGNDTIAGSSGNDILRGWNDDDSMDGGDGDDALFGGTGADSMGGGIGNDQIEGDDGNDTLTGGSGNDTLRGWNDNDNLDGGDGDDLLVGWSGDDSMVGGNGSDSLFGDDGADTLMGGAGGDVLQGGLGNDVYTFAAGFGFDGVRDYDYVAGNSDTFQFTGINLADLAFARAGDALRVERTAASAGSDVIYVNDWYMPGSTGAYRVETWIMGDGSVFTAAQIEALVV